MPNQRKNEEFVIYVVTLSHVTHYMSIEFIGGSCGYIIAQRALQSDLLGMIGSILAPIAIRRVLQWQQLKSGNSPHLSLRSLSGARELNPT